MATALPGAGAGADGMVGAAGTVGAPTIAVGHGAGALPGTTPGTILGMVPAGAAVTIGLGILLPYLLTLSADL